MDRLSLNLAGTQITDEERISVGAGSVVLGHDRFLGGADMVVRTAAGGGGTLLTETTDYIFENEDTTLSARVTPKKVYQNIKIVNGAFQTGSLFFSYKVITDLWSAGDINQLMKGWINPRETWKYASASTFTVCGDVTGIYSKGMGVKLTQTTVKYFYIIGVSYDGGTGLTTITVSGGTDYTLANAAITNNYYSIYPGAATGFPDVFTYAGGQFKINGKTLVCWGTGSANISNSSYGDVVFSFPLSFSDTNYHVKGDVTALVGGMVWTTGVLQAKLVGSATIRSFDVLNANRTGTLNITWEANGKI